MKTHPLDPMTLPYSATCPAVGCGPDDADKAVIRGVLFVDKRREGFVYVDSGHMHLHDVAVTDRYGLTVRASVGRLVRSIRQTIRCWIHGEPANSSLSLSSSLSKP